jgi:hypothetical protein
MPILKDVTNILKDESASFISTVQGNIRRAYPNNDYIRGAADTMRDDTKGNVLTVFGWKYFENVEKGIPPLIGFSPLKPANPLVRIRIFEWSKRAGLSFADDKERMRFAFLTRRKILYEGTKLWREKGRFGDGLPIYTPEIDKLQISIADKVAKLIINERIL